MTAAEWRLPPGMTGNLNLIRIGAIAAEDEEFSCPSQVATKVRPGVRQQVRPAEVREELETFTLGPFMSALDQIEFSNITIEQARQNIGRSGKRLHPGLVTFTRHALDNYVWPTVDGGATRLRPVRNFWVAQKTTARIWELYAWGRRYESPDGSLREFRFLRFGGAGERDRDLTQVAVAVYSTAFGAEAPRPELWSEPFQPISARLTVRRVQVVEIGLLGGPPVVLFTGTPAEAEAYFVEHGRHQIAGIAAGATMRPGANCMGCKQLTGCTAITRVPGLLGMGARRAPLRKASISDLRHYQKCPAQAHLRSLNLPKTYEYETSAELGHAVHGWLEVVHADRRCAPAAMPPNVERWTGGQWVVHSETAQLGRRMLSHHPSVCAFLCASEISKVRLEPRLTFHDTAAQVIVIAKPDMLYLDEGSWVWREVKTTRKRRWFHDDLLDEFPQLALAVLVLSKGVLRGDPAGSRVELEVLRPDGAEIALIDPTDPARVEKAGAVLRSMAEPWRADSVFEARPGQDCQWCPVSRWCPSFADNCPGAGTVPNTA